MTTYTTVETLSRKADRQRFLRDLDRALEDHAPAAKLVYLHHDKGDLTVRLSAPGKLDVMLDHSPRWKGVPLLHWHGAAEDLQGVAGAWSAVNVNRFHHRKATSFPLTLNGLIAMLINGLNAAADGSAFRAS